MALKTFGTNSSSSLSAFVVGFNDTIIADLRTMNNALSFDPPGESSNYSPTTAATGLINQTLIGTTRRVCNQAYIKNGVLIVPNRGQLILRNGDFIAWDTTTGWPIVISAYTAAHGPYTHVP